MSNVHTLGDLNRSNESAGGPAYGRMGGAQNPMGGMQPMDEESKQAVGLFSGLTAQGSGNSAGKPPREESYWDMWKSTFCPQFSMLSFTFMIWAINTLIYIMTLFLVVGPNKSLNYWVFLGPDPQTLDNWGALNPYKVRYDFQVWRLFLPLLMSVGFSTYMISSGALLVIGFMIENEKMSATRMAIFYFASGILANLFSCCCQAQLSVGCLPAVMALVAGLISMVIVNWKVLAGAGYMRICLIFMVVMIFVVMLLMSAQPDAVPGVFVGISLPAEAGGFMAGLCTGMMLMPYAPQRDSPYVKMIRKIGALLTFIYIAVIAPVFWFAVEPPLLMK